jgi:AhpD family alkylhydroperoxidase
MSHSRQQIEDFKRLAPAAYAALGALSRAAVESGLPPALVELVKIRVSQMNGCAYCLHFHLALARRHAVPQDKLDLLAGWREAPNFTDGERAALEWAEALTRLTHGDVPDAAYEAAAALFSEAELANLSAVVGVINAWNRISIGYRFTPTLANSQVRA